MGKFEIKNILWGLALWFIGYVLGIVLFPIVPQKMLGWIITPIGTLITIWVIRKKIKAESLRQYLFLAMIWVLIAVICDYFLLVKIFKPADGYYKPDVYLYYALTFLLPLLFGRRRRVN